MDKDMEQKKQRERDDAILRVASALEGIDGTLRLLVQIVAHRDLVSHGDEGKREERLWVLAQARGLL